MKNNLEFFLLISVIYDMYSKCIQKVFMHTGFFQKYLNTKESLYSKFFMNTEYT